MTILRLIFQQYRLPFVLMLVLTIISSALGIGVLAYINRYLLSAQIERPTLTLFGFALLVLAYLAVSVLAQVKLAKIGHGFVFSMQLQLIKRIMDSSQLQIQATGKAKILASLANDIRTMSIAFTRLPELLQGVLFVLACSAYLIYLSPRLFVVTAILLVLMMVVSHFIVLGHYRHFRKMRASEDELYRHYQTTLDGHKELALNRYRAERFFREEFSPEAANKRESHIYADSYHVLAVNWGSSVMLAAVGVVFYLAVYRDWASLADAITISMTILFMRGPLMVAVGALPTLMQSQVAINALDSLELSEHEADFIKDSQKLADDWQAIRLENVTYQHPSQGGKTFALAPINLTLKHGETVFLIGANGSGKSTLSMILAGLYAPSSGKIFVDDVEITEANRSAYRQLFASVFTDFHLFEQLLDGMGVDVADELIDTWLAHLQLSEKVSIKQSRLLHNKLSQGQRKRLGLLSATLESRSLLILDEWAADQDPQFRRVFYEMLLPLLKQHGYTVFAISHDDKYFHHAERIISMQQGVLHEHDSLEAAQVADESSR